MFKLSSAHLRKISEYLIDLSKLLLGATFVSIFVPGNVGGNFEPLTFIIGVFLALSCFMLGLKFLPISKL